MKVLFACGHTMTVSEAGDARPICVCGETKIRSVKTRAPKFVGHARGPCAKYEALPAKAVTLERTDA